MTAMTPRPRAPRPRGMGACHLCSLLVRVGWQLVDGMVRYGSAVTGDPEAAKGAERALTHQRRTRNEVADGLRSIERFLGGADRD